MDSMKTVETVNKLGVNGKKAANKLITAAKAVDVASNLRSERLAEFLVASHLEGIMLPQKVTADIAKCDRSMVSRLYRALTNYVEVWEESKESEGKEPEEGFQTALGVFSSKGYTTFTNEYNPRLRNTEKAAKPGAHTIEQKQAGKTVTEVQIAAKKEPEVTVGGPDHLIASIRAFNKAYTAGRIRMDTDQRLTLEIVLLECADLIGDKVGDSEAA